MLSIRRLHYDNVKLIVRIHFLYNQPASIEQVYRYQFAGILHHVATRVLTLLLN